MRFSINTTRIAYIGVASAGKFEDLLVAAGIDGAFRPALGPVSMLDACEVGLIKLHAGLPKLYHLFSDINVFVVPC